jgi:hypothetical protein
MFILVTCNKKIQYYLPFFFKSNILLHNDHNDDDIRMIGKILYNYSRTCLN